MKVWFLCKVKYQKEQEDGKVKNITEPYLVDAMSFTEAEARVYEKLGSVIRGDFQVTHINKTNIIDIFHYDDIDVWYKCKISYSVSEESGKEKKITNHMLVSANNVKQAYDRIHDSLNNMLVTFNVPEISESPIVEIFPYEEEDKEEIPANFKPLSQISEVMSN